MFDRFFKTLNYSSVNEDWRTEAAGLKIRENDKVLCITGSGARPLDLLIHNPASIVAIDINPVQNHLLRLKMAAMHQLDYDKYTAFLGLRPMDSKHRLDVLNRLSDELTPECLSFWEKHPSVICRGVLYEGRWERYYMRVSRLARILRPRLIKKLFEFEDLNDQRNFVAEHWDTSLWRLAYSAICNPVTSRLFLRDPAFYKYVDVPVAEILYESMQNSLMNHLANENFMMSLILMGKLSNRDLPPHLTEHGFEFIRSKLFRVEVETQNLITYLLEQAPVSFSRYSLSDVPSYLSASEFESLLNCIVRTEKPSARFVIRQFLTRYEIPLSLCKHLERDIELENKLEQEDRAFAYKFIVGEVQNV
jgi:S-adenosylmethionine-diacylglycerol 3-amino-3-carboxypropyl transferase